MQRKTGGQRRLPHLQQGPLLRSLPQLASWRQSQPSCRILQEQVRPASWAAALCNLFAVCNRFLPRVAIGLRLIFCQ